MKMLTFLSSILLSCLCMANAALDRDRAQPMPKDYIKSAHPYQEENKATRVDFDFHLKGLPRVDLKKQEIEVDMVLGLTWSDPRLKNISNDDDIKVREDIRTKKTFQFGHCPKVWGGGLPFNLDNA